MIAQHRLLSAAIVTALAAPSALAQTASPPTLHFVPRPMALPDS